MASRHADLFTAAIPMAASTGDEPIDRLGTIPTVRFEALRDLGHFERGGYVDALRRAGRWIAERWNRQAP
jgi:hypothetical protein